VDLQWTDRMLREELGMSNRDVADVSVRIIALFLEADILNCGNAVAALAGANGQSTHSLENNAISLWPRSRVGLSGGRYAA
jgi:hypothetical protein